MNDITDKNAVHSPKIRKLLNNFPTLRATQCAAVIVALLIALILSLILLPYPHSADKSILEHILQ